MKTITYNPKTHVLVPSEPTDEMLKHFAGVPIEHLHPSKQAAEFSAYKAMIAAAPQPEPEPEPNHNWCVGCSPDNCSGCGTAQVESEPVCEWVKADGANYIHQKWNEDYVAIEGDKLYTHPPADNKPVESEPVAWCLAYDDPNLKLRIHSNPSMCEAEIDAHVNRLNGALSKAPLYTMPQPDRVTTKENYVELDIHSNHSRTEQQRKLDGSLEVGQLLGNGQNQETSHSKTAGDILLADAFRGDDANLIESIVALVSLDRAGVLVPHGIGGHARSLLESAAIRLSQPDRTAELEAALKVAKDALEYYIPMIKQGDSPAEEALAKINEVLK